MGSGYVMDHCISAFHKWEEDRLLRIYVTDSLMAIANNSARAAGGHSVSARFYDLVYTKQDQKEERTANDIVQNIRKKLRGKK